MSDVVKFYKQKLIEELAKISNLPQAKLQEEKDTSKSGEEIVLRYRPIVLDRGWMDDSEAASSDAQYNKLMAAIGNLNISGIADIDDFLGAMNDFMTREVDIQDHTEAISRIDILRTFYHLLTSPNEQSKGYDFEYFLAYVFGGRVIPASTDGIADLVFPATNISAKFIKPKGAIKGSIVDLQATVEQDGGINYIVATKGKGELRGVVHFYSFTIDANNLSSVPVDGKGKQMAFTLGKLAKNADLFIFQELSNSPIDLRGCLELTETIFEALNQKFQNLLSEMQGLVDQVDDLMYKAKKPKETKKSAGAAKKKAEKVKTKAGNIEASS